MPKNQSEKQVTIFSRNVFLNRYVWSNPNQHHKHSKRSEEFCDCLVHMADLDIVIQIKKNEELAAKDWFKRQVLGKAWKQLTKACTAICSSEWEVWDRTNSELISAGGQEWRKVVPVIVFESEKIKGSYQQVAKGDEKNERVPCNIFSMEDFLYATSVITTGVDFFNYLFFRFNKLKDYQPGHQLFPFYSEKGVIRAIANASTNEEIMVAEFVGKLSKKPSDLVENAKKWHENLAILEKDGANPTLMQLLSYITMQGIMRWDECLDKLKRSFGPNDVTISDGPVLVGTVDSKKCGILLSYFPAADPLARAPYDDQALLDILRRAMTNDGLDTLFILQYTASKTVWIATANSGDARFNTGNGPEDNP